jgi:hypothetical protein
MLYLLAHGVKLHNGAAIRAHDVCVGDWLANLMYDLVS